jgi:hypothetical protein
LRWSSLVIPAARSASGMTILASRRLGGEPLRFSIASSIEPTM